MKECSMRTSMYHCRILMCVGCGVFLVPKYNIGMVFTSMQEYLHFGIMRRIVRFACHKCIKSRRVKWTPRS